MLSSTKYIQDSHQLHVVLATCSTYTRRLPWINRRRTLLSRLTRQAQTLCVAALGRGTWWAAQQKFLKQYIYIYIYIWGGQISRYWFRVTWLSTICSALPSCSTTSTRRLAYSCRTSLYLKFQIWLSERFGQKREGRVLFQIEIYLCKKASTTSSKDSFGLTFCSRFWCSPRWSDDRLCRCLQNS